MQSSVLIVCFAVVAAQACQDIQAGCQANWCGNEYWKSQCLSTCGACPDDPGSGSSSIPESGSGESGSGSGSGSGDSSAAECKDIQEGCQANWCGNAFWKSQCLATCQACSESTTHVQATGTPTGAPTTQIQATGTPTGSESGSGESGSGSGGSGGSSAAECKDIQERCQANWCGDAYWKSQCLATCQACSEFTTPLQATGIPTGAPTIQATDAPTNTQIQATGTPTGAPTTPVQATDAPTLQATDAPTSGGGDHDFGVGLQVIDRLESVSALDQDQVMRSQDPDLSWRPSNIYKWQDMIQGVKDMYERGVGGQKIWLGDDGQENPDYGLVSIAAFMAQSMKETIKYDVCDENNWDQTSGYAASNSCGQLGQSYQDYNCPAGEEHMQCEVDPDMMIRASTSATWYGAPGPMFCGPKSAIPEAPKWSLSGAWCAPKQDYDTNLTVPEFVDYMNSGEGCRDYEGQKDGKWDFCPEGGCPNNPAPAFGREARTDVEGCCWWGRGVIQTTGVCNFGKFNYFMGAKAAARGEPALFPTIDFCRTPDAICTSTEHPELKWIAGLFFWMKEVQNYNEGGWSYQQTLKDFVDGGFQGVGTDSGFIASVSGIVNRGCHNPPCAAGAVDGGAERADNFRKVLEAMGVV